YFKTYLTKFDRLHYFSYFAENISEFTDDAELLAKVTVYGKPAWLPDALYSFFMPLVHWRAFRSCGALRVFQATGAFPLIFSSIAGGAPALVTFGYDYSEFARLRNKGIFVRWMIGMAERM